MGESLPAKASGFDDISDDSKPDGSRGAALAALYAHAAALAVAGDLGAARALHATIGALLGEAAEGPVVDLEAERAKRR